MLTGDMLHRSAALFPKKAALIYGEYELTYQAFNNRVNCLASSILKLGFKKGDRLAVFLPNCIAYFEIYFAAAKIGGIFVPINNTLKKAELQWIVDYVNPRYFFFDSEYIALIESIEMDSAGIEYSFSKGDVSFADVKPYESLIERGIPEESDPKEPVIENDRSSIFFTSGTTGHPKGAVRTHRQEYVNAMTNAVELKLDHNDRPLFLFPFYHVPFVDNTIRHVLMGNSIIIRKEGNFSAEEVLDLISREKVTLCQFVPTMINAMIQRKENVRSYDLSNFRMLIYVGSTIPVAVLRQAMKMFECRFIQYYGQSESGPAVAALRPDDHVTDGSKMQMEKLASAGRPVLGFEVKIVNVLGTEVKTGEVGEIAVKGDALMEEYWNLPDATESSLQNKWFHTGDMGRLDDEGYLYIVDRKHDMIISGGKNIYPREVEERLYQHEDVMEAVVIGVPDDYWGESVRAIVVLKEGSGISEEQLIDYCRENMASYKKPRMIELRKTLPKSPTGKILKRLVREKYWKKEERKV